MTPAPPAERDPLAALLRHLEVVPNAPLPEPLRLELLRELRRTRAERDRLLRELAELIAPGASKWKQANKVAARVARFLDSASRLRTGHRKPAQRSEELLLDAWRCGAGLPTSRRRIWSAITGRG